MTEPYSHAPADPWTSSSSDSPDRSESRLTEIRQELARRPRRRYSLLFGTVVLLVLLGDQLSKAWFVYRLGTHEAQSFGAFLSSYLRLFAGFADGGQLVVSHYLPFKPPIPVFGDWARWLLTTNTGAAWSLFAGNSLALSAVSIIIASALFLLWRRSFRQHFWMSLACGAIIGGALGNFVDRFRLHEVVDFISIRIPLIGRLIPALGDPYDFPIFNVADACAVCGTIGLALYLVGLDIAVARRARKRRAERKAALAALKLEQAEALRQEEARERRLESLHEAAGEQAVSGTPTSSYGSADAGAADSPQTSAQGHTAADGPVLSVEGTESDEQPGQPGGVVL